MRKPLKIAAACLLCCAMGTPLGAGAADSVIQISPFLVEKEASRGQAITQDLIVANAGPRPMRLFMALQDFLPAGNDGGADFLPAGQYAPLSSGLARWIEVAEQPKELLAPGESTQVMLKIQVPAEAEPGTHYGAAVFTLKDPTNSLPSAGSEVFPQAAALLIFDIDRSFEKGEVAGFQRRDLGNQQAVFQVIYRNTGSSSLKPKGEIEITNVFGQKLAEAYVNRDALTVLPGTERLFVSKTPFGSQFGRYKAKLTLYYGSKKLQNQAEMVFWVWSWKIFIFWLIGLALLGMAGYLGVKKYNKWLIHKEMSKF